MANMSIGKLEWTNDLKTGVAEIDDQHMILVHTLNEASEKLAIEASAESLEQITQDLLSYALYHFETEEELMQQYAYQEVSKEDAQRHLDQHRGFSSKVVSVRDGLKAGDLIAPEALLGFLNEWLVNHIQNTDKRLASYILECRKSA